MNGFGGRESRARTWDDRQQQIGGGSIPIQQLFSAQPSATESLGERTRLFERELFWGSPGYPVPGPATEEQIVLIKQCRVNKEQAGGATAGKSVKHLKEKKQQQSIAVDDPVWMADCSSVAFRKVLSTVKSPKGDERDAAEEISSQQKKGLLLWCSLRLVNGTASHTTTRRRH